MSDIDLDAIRKRVEAATPGPWRADDTEIYTEDLALIVDGRRWVGEVMKDDPDATRADSEFIAHARTDVPALLDEVERLTAKNKRLQGFVDSDIAFRKSRQPDVWPAGASLPAGPPLPRRVPGESLKPCGWIGLSPMTDPALEDRTEGEQP